MVHRKPAKGACIAVRENEFQTFESHKDKEISLLFKQFAKKTTKKPRHFHLKTAMSDGFYGMTQRKNPWHETNKTSASPKKNCAYSTYSTVFVDQWVNCFFGSFPHPLYGRGGWVPIFRVCSGLFGFGPKPGDFVVQKRNETPETPETLETPESLTVSVRIAFLSTYQRTRWQS